MKLNVAQWLWMLASVALFATMLIDIVGIAQIEPIYWLLGLGVLMPLGWWVMPSMRELNEAQRQRR